MAEGTVILITGDGKGKTTAALGQAFRALGQGWRVCFLQFIKSEGWPTGERKLAERFGDQLRFRTLGRGFTWEGEREEHLQAARAAWQIAREEVLSDRWELVVLDELTYLVRDGMVPEEEVLELIRRRPSRLSLVITGRGASPGLVAAAEIVSEIRPIKFPAARPAREGIEY